jgi:hypothetical protein
VGNELKKLKGLKAVGESLLKLPGVDKAMKLTNIKIISPTTLAMQPYMDGQMYRYESKSPEQRVQSNYMVGEYRKENAAISLELEERVNFVDFNFYKVNPILDYGAAIRDVEYGFVMRASQGIKTEGFSTERMAEVASHKATPRLLKNWQESGKKNCIQLISDK